MKNGYFILIFPLLFAFNSKAQLNFIDSTKNEIGINFNPRMNSKGITSNSDYLCLQYKHHYSSLTLRIGVAESWASNYNKFDYSRNMVRVNDSMVSIPRKYYEQNSFRLNFGFEKEEMLKNRWKFYYGIDLLGGFTNEVDKSEQRIYSVWGHDSTFSQYNLNAYTITHSKNFINIGVAAVAGFEYYFGKRISAGIQGYYPITFEFETTEQPGNLRQIKFDQKYCIFASIHF